MLVASPALPARSAVGLPCPPSGPSLLSSAPAIWAPLKQLHSCLSQHLPSPSSHWALTLLREIRVALGGPLPRSRGAPEWGGDWTFSWPPHTRDSGDLISYRGLWLTALPITFFGIAGPCFPPAPSRSCPARLLLCPLACPGWVSHTSPCSQVPLQPFHGDLLGG